jgi:hypothetical protein
MRYPTTKSKAQKAYAKYTRLLMTSLERMRYFRALLNKKKEIIDNEYINAFVSYENVREDVKRYRSALTHLDNYYNIPKT